MFQRVKEEFSSVYPETSFEIFSDSEGDVLLETDPEMLHQILTVFVSNSMKFAGDKCNVRLSFERTADGQIKITESDDGPGISEEALPHVFERFYRADEAHTRSAGGSGLGLAIAKTLAEALGAGISAGTAEPHGALFTLTLKQVQSQCD